MYLNCDGLEWHYVRFDVDLQIGEAISVEIEVQLMSKYR